MAKTKKWEIKKLQRKHSLKKSSQIVLKNRLNTVTKSIAKYLADKSVENLHSMRIAIRRLRYGLEIFLVCFEKKNYLAFYDLIVDTRKAINNVENGIDVSSADNEMRNGYRKLFETAKALVAHIVKEPAFDKVNDMGPVGIETYQSNNFIEIIQHTENTLKTVESELL